MLLTILASILIAGGGRADAQATRINVQEAGVRPGQDPSKNDQALAKLIDGATGSITLYFPGDRQNYTIYRTINIPDGLNLRLLGDGPTSRLVMYGKPNPVVMVGFGQRPQGKILTPDHGFDLFGKLDGTAPWGPNQRFGYRTLNDSHLIQMQGSFASTRYESIRRLTWEYIYDSTTIGEQSAPFAGIDGVWELIDGPAWSLWFWTIDTPGGPPVRHAMGFMGPTKAGVHRITIQLDLDARTLVGWVDGVQAKSVGEWTGPVPVSLAPNEAKPFGLGGVSPTVFRHGNDWSNATNYDRAICGFAMYRGLHYAVGVEGTPQRRLDGRVVSDALRCFDGDAGDLIGLLDLGTQPADLKERWLTVIGRNGDPFRYTSAFLVSREHDRPCWCPLTIEGMALESPGDCVAVGAAMGMDFRDSSFGSGEWGRAIGTWPTGANYFHRVHHCTLAGGEAALFAHAGMWDLDRIDIPVHGRNTFWMRDSSVSLRHVNTSGFGSPDRIVYAVGCPRVVIDDLEVDIESGQYPTVAAVEARTSTNMGGYTEAVVIRDLGVGGLKHDIPLVKLGVQPGYPDWPARIDLSQVQFGARPDLMSCMVEVNGKSWFGTVDITDDTLAKPWVRSTVAGPCQVQAVGPLATPSRGPGPPHPATSRRHP